MAMLLWLVREWFMSIYKCKILSGSQIPVQFISLQTTKLDLPQR